LGRVEEGEDGLSLFYILKRDIQYNIIDKSTMSDIIDDLLATYTKDVCDFSTGKIYQIKCDDSDDVYIGSTCQKLEDRFSSHLSDYAAWKNAKARHLKYCKKKKKDTPFTFKGKSTTSRLIFQQGFARISLVEDFPCNFKYELRRREGEVIQATANTVNVNIAGRTRAEYRRDKRQENDRVCVVKPQGHTLSMVDMLNDLNMF
jgi:hypothetical protein